MIIKEYFENKIIYKYLDQHLNNTLKIIKKYKEEHENVNYTKQKRFSNNV